MSCASGSTGMFGGSSIVARSTSGTYWNWHTMHLHARMSANRSEAIGSADSASAAAKRAI
jgi:hypothetical protein